VAAAHVLDLFAGTGALGIEALSRGAARAVFVEADRGTATLIERNLAVLGRADTRVLPMSASRALTLLAREGARFDLAFLDPPYDAALLAPTLAELANARLMRDEAVVVCEHSRRTPPPTPPDSWGCVDSRSYGEVGLVLFQPSGGAA
jgi:16S rRNA (guanine966-N2)-methyltransferase